MKVKDIMAITKAESFDVYSIDGMTHYGTENSFYKISDEVKEATIEEITASYGTLYIKVKEVFPACDLYDKKNHK